MKKVLRSILIIVIILIIGILYISYITNHNQDELNNITQNIKDNYSVKDEITYSNRYGNYYIFTTESDVYVLNNEYQKVYQKEISSLATNEENLPIIYKTNKLMYEKTIRKKDKITYEYYDALTNQLIKETTLERK
ncbi:MAG: hypothetical protein SO108_01870 [Bacilli bacterium]|nr:hypothetical protein [Bacilli bacterium]MDY4996442.1 hypothetical protein [Bacilli bacterium]